MVLEHPCFITSNCFVNSQLFSITDTSYNCHRFTSFRRSLTVEFDPIISVEGLGLFNSLELNIKLHINGLWSLLIPKSHCGHLFLL